MKTKLLILLVLTTSVAFGQELGRAVCQGHKKKTVVWDVLEFAERLKARFDKEMSYDRYIKEYNCDLYKEGQQSSDWILEYSWTHVDNCPECDKSIVVNVPEIPEDE